MMKLFSKNFNLCDHNSPTLQTDRQTDGQTDGQTDDMRSQYRALHYSASRGKKSNYKFFSITVLTPNDKCGRRKERKMDWIDKLSTQNALDRHKR